jgi:hypothetical protein
MHPADLRARLRQATWPGCSARGSIVVRVAAGRRSARGCAWLPMHWGSQFMNSAGVNALTTSARDPFSQQPELKHAAVAVDKAELPWQLVDSAQGRRRRTGGAPAARRRRDACSASSPSPASGCTVVRTAGDPPRGAHRSAAGKPPAAKSTGCSVSTTTMRRSSMSITSGRSASAPSPPTAA